VSCALQSFAMQALPARDPNRIFPTDGKTDPEESTDNERWPQATGICCLQKLIQRDPGTRSRQINRPHIVKRNAGKKVVYP